MKTCEALCLANAQVTLGVTNRRGSLQGDPFTHYGVTPSFSVRELPVIDLFPYLPSWLFAPAFVLERATFVRQAVRFAKAHPDAVLYTRDARMAEALSRVGRVFYEIHALPPTKVLKKLEKVTGIVCMTRALTDRVRETLPETPCTVIPDAVEMAVFHPLQTKAEARAALGIPPEARVVVYGGRFSTMGAGKGLGMLDLAMQEIATRIPDARLYLVGGSEQDFLKMEGRAPGDATRCISNRPRTELALYYRAADALVMPFPNTPHYAYEMSPLKMFEYMASGTPIVTSDLPSVRDVLNEDLAVFYPADDRAALVQVLLHVLQDPAAYAAYGARAQELAAGTYTWTHRAQAVLDWITKNTAV